MEMKSRKVLTLAAAALFVVLGSGCSTAGKELKEVRAMAESAQASATEAASAAAMADAKADAAASKADQALGAANAAQACCAANSEKMSRMYETAVRK